MTVYLCIYEILLSRYIFLETLTVDQRDRGVILLTLTPGGITVTYPVVYRNVMILTNIGM